MGSNDRRENIVIAWATLIGILLMSISGGAEPALTDLRVTFDSPLPVEAEKDGARVFQAQSGTSAHFSVVASFDDGTTRDVTADAVLRPEGFTSHFTLPQRGEIAFAHVFRPTVAAVSVGFGGHERLLSFVVHP